MLFLVSTHEVPWPNSLVSCKSLWNIKSQTYCDRYMYIVQTMTRQQVPSAAVFYYYLGIFALAIVFMLLCKLYFCFSVLVTATVRTNHIPSLASVVVFQVRTFINVLTRWEKKSLTGFKFLLSFVQNHLHSLVIPHSVLSMLWCCL